ncbi:hypothetical protein QC864_001658 [Klebsiella pneumoniae]
MALTLLAANNAQAVLAAGISASATSLTVNSGTGSLFPAPSDGVSFFKLTLIDAATGQLTEIMHVTARTGDTMKIERGQEGTTARAWSANDIAANMMTAGTLNYILANFQPLDATLTALAGLPTGANKLPYFTGNDTAAQTDLTSVGRDIIGKNTIADILTYLGLQNPDGSVGRLIGVRVFTISGIYNSSAGTKSVIVDAIGGGAGSGGVPATSSSQSGISAAGSSGSFARARYSSNFSGLQIQIGAGGVAGTSTTPGGDGGVTTFGSLLSCPGGKGSIAGIVSATQAVAAAPVQSLSPTGSNIIRASSGAPVNNAIQTAFGTASGWNPSAAGDGMFSDGLGGSGVYQGASKSAVNGNAGTRGIVVVWEYA